MSLHVTMLLHNTADKVPRDLRKLSDLLDKLSERIPADFANKKLLIIGGTVVDLQNLGPSKEKAKVLFLKANKATTLNEFVDALEALGYTDYLAFDPNDKTPPYEKAGAVAAWLVT